MIKAHRGEGLNVIPFIDIVLVLLAMVLSISTFIAHGQIKIELPHTDSSLPASQNEEKITILINADNIFYIDDKAVSIESIKDKINSIKPEIIVALKSDKDAKFDSFVQIIDILRLKNHKNFQIITQKQ